MSCICSLLRSCTADSLRHAHVFLERLFLTRNREFVVRIRESVWPAHLASMINLPPFLFLLYNDSLAFGLRLSGMRSRPTMAVIIGS
jgi:hypothetical protein